jgi:hypothetical protein
MQSKQYKPKSFQSHYELSDRIRAMIRALQQRKGEEVDAAIKSLKEQELEHYRKGWMTGDLFITIK